MTGENRPSPRLCPKKGPLPSRSPAAWGRALSKENLLPPQPLRGLPWLLRENQDGSEQPQCGPLSDPVCRAHPGAGSVQRDRWEWWSGRLGAPAVLTQVTEELERSESAWRPALLLPGAGDVGLGRWDPLKKGLDPSCLGQPQSLCPNLGLVPTRSPPCRSCPGWRTQPFSDHSSCGSAGSQELAQLWWAHVFRSSLERVQTRNQSFGRMLKPRVLWAERSDFPGAHSTLT